MIRGLIQWLRSRQISPSWGGVLFLAVILLGFLAWPGLLYAQGGTVISGDKVIFGSSFVLESGQILDGDLVIFGGSAQVQQGAEVTGDAVVFGGSIDVAGKVKGDVVAFGGTINLESTAQVSGDAVTMGGMIHRMPGAEVRGEVITGQGPGMEWNGPSFELPNLPRFGAPFSQNGGNGWSRPRLGWMERMFLGGMSAIAWTAILAGLGVLLILLAPNATEQTALAIKTNPLLAFVVGFGVTLVLFLVALILILLICFIPLGVGLILAWVVALFFGWLALGWLLGRELLKVFGASVDSPIWEMVVGVTLLTLLWKLPGVFPCIGGVFSFLVMFVAGNMALGGVALTRFGTRSYPPTPPAPPPPPEKTLPEHSASTVPKIKTMDDRR